MRLVITVLNKSTMYQFLISLLERKIINNYTENNQLSELPISVLCCL